MRVGLQLPLIKIKFFFLTWSPRQERKVSMCSNFIGQSILLLRLKLIKNFTLIEELTSNSHVTWNQRLIPYCIVSKMQISYFRSYKTPSRVLQLQNSFIPLDSSHCYCLGVWVCTLFCLIFNFLRSQIFYGIYFILFVLNWGIFRIIND